MTDSGAFSNPRDAAVMEAILKEMGVEDYEPNVIHQMLEFSYSEYIYPEAESRELLYALYKFHL